MLVEGMMSRPVYAPLTPRPGRLHVVVVDDEGILAVAHLAATAPDGFLAGTRIIFVTGRSAGEDQKGRLEALVPAIFVQVPNVAVAIATLRAELANARMGTQIYAAGTESLIGQVVQAALEEGLELGAIGAEHRGSLERRVQCVHCKQITESVTTQPATCSGCGLSLLVRDHYSRRMGAFQGVCIDAEEPGTAPEPKVVFA